MNEIAKVSRRAVRFRCEMKKKEKRTSHDWNPFRHEIKWEREKKCVHTQNYNKNTSTNTQTNDLLSIRFVRIFFLSLFSSHSNQFILLSLWCLHLNILVVFRPLSLTLSHIIAMLRQITIFSSWSFTYSHKETIESVQGFRSFGRKYSNDVNSEILQ